MADSNQQVVQTATTLLKAVIEGSGDFAKWVGWEALQNGATLEQALNIVHAIEDGHYSLNDLFNSAQSKVSGTYANGINGEPNPTLTVLGQTFEIGHLLGDTTVDTWTSGNTKNLQYHSREYFTSVGDDEPEGYVEGWENPNKAPVVSAGAEAVYEDGVLNDSVADYASDANGDTLTYSLDAEVPGLTFNKDGSYSFDATHAAYQSLAKGEPLPVIVNFTVDDGHGGKTSSTLTITVTGTNDAPVVSGAVTGDATEGGATSTLNALTNASDIDDASTLSVVNAPASLPAGVSYDAASHSFTLDPSVGAYNHLAAGATETVSVSYGVSDEHGAITPASVKWTVTGTNDAPVAKPDFAAATEDGVIINGSLDDFDADDGATPTYTLDAPVAGLRVDTNGDYHFDAGDKAYQKLGAGETTEVVANYTVDDNHGASAQSTLTITVTGTNDAPVVTGAVTGAATEGAATSTLNALANASDIDDSATLSVVDVPAQASLPAGVSYDAASHSFTLDPSVGAYNHLAAGATETVSVSYTVSDEHGAITPASVKWTVTGTNDAPVATADTNFGLEDTVIMGSVATNDKDADDGAVLKYSLNAPVAGLTINEDGTYSLDASNTAYQNLHLGDNQVVTANYTVTDEHGASATSTLSITLTGTADQYHGVADVTTSFTKTAVNSGNGNQTAESFHFDLSLPTIEDAFDFSGKVTLTVKGDIDGLNENATATAISGELVDENDSEPGLLYLVGTIGNNNDKDATDNGDDVTVSGSTDVGANGFADGHVVFDVAVSGDVDSGAIVSASLSYDYWA